MTNRLGNKKVLEEMLRDQNNQMTLNSSRKNHVNPKKCLKDIQKDNEKFNYREISY